MRIVRSCGVFPVGMAVLSALLFGWPLVDARAAEKKAAPAPAKQTAKPAGQNVQGKKAGDNAGDGKAQVQKAAKPKPNPPQRRHKNNNKQNKNKNNDKNNDKDNDKDKGPRVLTKDPTAPNPAQKQWMFSSKKDLVGWCGDPSDYEVTSDDDLIWMVRGDGVHLGRDGGMPNLRTRGLNLKAGDVKKLSVGLQVEKPADGQLLLFYWSNGTDFNAEHCLRVTLKNTVGAQDVIFDLSAQPKWKGDVSAIKIEPPSGAGEIVIRRVVFE